MPKPPRQEPRPTIVFVVIDTVSRVLLPTVLASVALFLITVVFGLVGQESFDVDGDPFDALLRASVGVTAIAASAGLVLLGYVRTARMVALSTVLARGRSRPGERLVHPDPRGRLTDDPALGAQASSIALLCLGGLMLIFFISELAGGSTDGDLVYPIGLVATITLDGACLAGLVGLRRLTRWWRSQRLPTLGAFAQKQPESGGDSQLVQKVEMALYLGGFCIFFAGVFIRQPGRYAKAHHYGSLGETMIGALVLIGGVLMGAGLALSIINTAIRLIGDLRQIADPGRTDTAERRLGSSQKIRGLLTDDGPFDRLVAYLTALVVIALELWLTLSWITPTGSATIDHWYSHASRLWPTLGFAGGVMFAATAVASWGGTWLRNKLRSQVD